MNDLQLWELRAKNREIIQDVTYNKFDDQSLSRGDEQVT